jgi:hypothetical protein
MKIEDAPVVITDNKINVNKSQTSPEYFAYNITGDQFLHDTADYHQE